MVAGTTEGVDVTKNGRKPLLAMLGAVLSLSMMVLPFKTWGQELEEEQNEEEVERRLALRLLPLLRVGLGPGVTPRQQQVVRLDCDVAVAARFNTLPGRELRFELVPELGYAFHSGEGLGGHYGTIGFGFRVGTIWVAGSTVTSALLGASQGSFDVGIRAGLRLEVVLGLFGLEIAYESRNLEDEPFHGLHVVVTFDAALIFMPMLLTRFGWSLGGRS